METPGRCVRFRDGLIDSHPQQRGDPVDLDRRRRRSHAERSGTDGTTTVVRRSGRRPDRARGPFAGRAESGDAIPRPNQVGYGATPSPAPSGGSIDDPGILRLLLELPRVELLPPQELPTRWLDLSCFDLVFISRADLEGMAANQPSAWQALRDWVASGPTLCVYEMELSDERLAGLEALLGITRTSDATTDGAAQGRWQTANPSGNTEDIPALNPRGTSMTMEDTTRRRSLRRPLRLRPESPSRSSIGRSIEAVSWPCKPASRWRRRRPKPLGCSMN